MHMRISIEKSSLCLLHICDGFLAQGRGICITMLASIYTVILMGVSLQPRPWRCIALRTRIGFIYD